MSPLSFFKSLPNKVQSMGKPHSTPTAERFERATGAVGEVQQQLENNASTKSFLRKDVHRVCYVAQSATEKTGESRWQVLLAKRKARKDLRRELKVLTRHTNPQIRQSARQVLDHCQGHQMGLKHTAHFRQLVADLHRNLVAHNTAAAPAPTDLGVDLQADLSAVPPDVHSGPPAEQLPEVDPGRSEPSLEEAHLPTVVSAEAWRASIFHDHSVIDQDGAREMYNYLQGRKNFGIGDKQPLMLNVHASGKPMLSHLFKKPQAAEQAPIGASPAAPKAPHDAAKAAASRLLRYGEGYKNHGDPGVAAAAAFLVREAQTVLNSEDTPNVHLVGSQDMIDAFEIIALRGTPQANQPTTA